MVSVSQSKLGEVDVNQEPTRYRDFNQHMIYAGCTTPKFAVNTLEINQENQESIGVVGLRYSYGPKCQL